MIALVLAWILGGDLDALHERAHVMCERAVYLAIAPAHLDEGNGDDPTAEAVAWVACRSW